MHVPPGALVRELVGTPRRAAAALAGALAVVLAIGIPTDVVPNPWFTRMTPVRVLDVMFLAATAIVLGLLAASYVGDDNRDHSAGRRALGGGLMSWLAVGCPICNKLVVALIGISGALNYFEPLQPLLGAGGAAFGVWALRIRTRALTACARPQAAP